MTEEYFRGHPVVFDETKQEYRYEDTGELLADVSPRPCAYCGEFSSLGEPDPCLGQLPGVESACCGHGIAEQAYIRFENGTMIEGFTEVREARVDE